MNLQFITIKMVNIVAPPNYLTLRGKGDLLVLCCYKYKLMLFVFCRFRAYFASGRCRGFALLGRTSSGIRRAL